MTADPPVSLWPDPKALGALTDLYQLTMMAGYAASGIDRVPATFELFVRRLPAARAYLVFAGLEQAIGDLLQIAFSAEQVEWVRALPAFSAIDPSWFESLTRFRFEGDVWSVPEGTIVFAGEPLVRVEAPLAQAQWVETFLLASLGYPTLVASKAARIVEAASGRPLFDFGARRGHGPHAALLNARSSYLAGFDGTSHVEAARRLGIRCVGTMAHAWVQAFASESDAFGAFSRSFPNNNTLLVDTYDTLTGVECAAAIEPPIQSIRIDSGDLGALARSARSILDARGRRDVTILASGDLDEFKIHELVASGAPIDAFGVGTELITSRDAPALSMVYKMVELGGEGRIKLSPGKKTYPLGKQVDRHFDADGRMSFDRVRGRSEASTAEPLLVPIVRAGRLATSLPSLGAIRDRCRSQLARLPESLKGIDAAGTYPLEYSPLLQEEANRLGVI